MTVETIRTAAVVGAGYMGGGIAQVLAMSGMPVAIADVSADVARSAFDRLVEEARRLESAGRFPSGAGELVAANVRAAASIEEAVADVDYVQEAVLEIPEVKRDVLATISRAARADTIIGSNTSTLPVHELDYAVERPERFLNVHWSNPAPFIPGIELITGEHTDLAIVPAIERMLADAGRQTARIKDSPGFVLNRLQYVLLKEAMAIVEEGVASLEDVDTVVRTTLGFRLPFFGPFAIADMAGLDVYAACFRTFERAYGERLSPPRMLLDAVEAGRLGTKTGSGLTGDYTPEEVDRIVAYRSEAYSRMAQLVAELGPSPFVARDRPTAESSE